MKKRILIVDEAPYIRVKLRDIAVKYGYSVAGEVDNRALAVEKYNELRPDLIIMDLPKFDIEGLAAIVKIKSINSDAHIIVCSTAGDQKNVLSAIKAGASEFIIKPFTEERVVQSIYKVIGV